MTNEDIVTEKGKFYYPLNIWAIKKPTRTKALEFARKYNLNAFQWRGFGSFVSHQKPPDNSSIITLLLK